jgi:hypothetical protein
MGSYPAEPAYAYYGGGILVNIDQLMGTDTAMGSYTPTGSGITYAVTSVPAAGLRIYVGNSVNGGTDYCANVSSLNSAIPWSVFNSECWTNAGVYLTAAPVTSHVEFYIPANSAATP